MLGHRFVFLRFVQTILSCDINSADSDGKSAGRHWGYVRDAPAEVPSFTAMNQCPSSSSFTATGDNIFAALLGLAAKAKKDEKSAAVVTALEECAAEQGHAVESKGGGAAWKSRKKRQV